MAPKGELTAADKKLRLINAATGDVGREISQLDAGNASLRGVPFHPSGDLLISEQGVVLMWKLNIKIE